jgi:hypothetical protein
MADERTTYTRMEVVRILRVSERTLLRMKGHEVHPWGDPDDPSGRKLLYDRAEIDKLARRSPRRGIRGLLAARRAEHFARDEPAPSPKRKREEEHPLPRAPPVRRDGPEQGSSEWEKELDARRARGEPDFPDDPGPPTRRKR